MDKLKAHSTQFFKSQNLDALAIGVLDFKSGSFSSFQLDHFSEEGGEPVFFDLASLSKPLVNSLGKFSAPERVSEEIALLLNHRGGLPAWGLLPRHGWKEILESYPIQESPTLYSDYSALRFMLEFNRSGQTSLREVASQTWDEEVVFWKDLTNHHTTVQNGFRNGRPNLRTVHDPNAFVINDFVSHAGLFGTVSGVCKTLLSFDKKYELLDSMKSSLEKSLDDGGHERFVHGWDTVADTSNTLAGNGCGKHVFGHLGFTGTSIWIDPAQKLGYVLLTNATKLFWHDKHELNLFRKSLGEFIWSGLHH